MTVEKVWRGGKHVGWRYVDRTNGTTKKFTSSKNSLRELKRQAQAAQEKDREHRHRKGTGYYTTIEDLRSWTAKAIIFQYMYRGNGKYLERDALNDILSNGKDVQHLKDEFEDWESKVAPNISDTLWKFMGRSICSLDLHAFNHEVAKECIEGMLGETYKTHGSEVEKQYTARTIERTRGVLLQVWERAKGLPGLQGLENVWKGIKVPGATGGKRQRGLKKGELEKLISLCDGCEETNRWYIPHAINLVAQTIRTNPPS